MRAEECPNFVAHMLAAGTPIVATGHDIYLMGKGKVSDEICEQVLVDVRAVCDLYGRREHLSREIVGHLRSLGHFVDLEELPPLAQLH